MGSRATHGIVVDGRSGTIEVTLAGTMSTDDVALYMDDLRRVMSEGRIGPGYGIVIDVTACTIQTQDMIRSMGERMTAMPRARAVAIVSKSQLARLQIRRLFSQPYARLVSTVEEGRGWVNEGREPPPTTFGTRDRSASA